MGHHSENVTGVDTRQALALGLGVAAFALVGLALAEVCDVTLLLNPFDAIARNGPHAWVGAGLLVADIVLPVPSSLVMLAHGALFGVIPGAALSILGRTGNALVGVLMGRWAGHWLNRRGVSRSLSEMGKSGELVRRWGLTAVVLTRPIPVLAESTLVAAAASSLSPSAVIGAAVVGAVPEAMFYAVAGDTAASHASGAIVVVALIVSAAMGWTAVARIESMRSRRKGILKTS